MTRKDLPIWVVNALEEHGGRASVVEVSRHIWNCHKEELEEAGDLYFTWQYEIRWAANILRRHGIVKESELSPKGIWELRLRDPELTKRLEPLRKLSTNSRPLENIEEI